MPLRDVLVVIENTENVAPRIAAAAALVAGDTDARIVGLYATGYPLSTSYGDLAGWTQLVDAYMTAQRNEGTTAEAAFRQELATRHRGGDWLYREDDATLATTALAAQYDIVVMGQPDPEASTGDLVGLQPEQVVLGCGRPVLVVPYAGNFVEIGKRVLVAWNATREAARALHDAMPLLERAEGVTVIEVDPPGSIAGVVRLTAEDVAAGLSARGIAATAETETAGDISVDDLLLSRAADRGVDLLVMGGYGHSRLREFVMGGVSRGIFQHMTVPVLMSH
ncbi:MAG: universal stress protein [Alphaproteobacteria bacterium]|nr:universal stress protein [Alphaproteobacteria bacterium]